MSNLEPHYLYSNTSGGQHLWLHLDPPVNRCTFSIHWSPFAKGCKGYFLAIWKLRATCNGEKVVISTVSQNPVNIQRDKIFIFCCGWTVCLLKKDIFFHRCARNEITGDTSNTDAYKHLQTKGVDTILHVVLSFIQKPARKSRPRFYRQTVSEVNM